MADISRLRIGSLAKRLNGNISQKVWGNYTNISGNNIWTDGENIYYSSSNTQYVLDKATSTWVAKSWVNLDSFIGSNIWTDGENIYFSYGTSHYVLDKATSTWSTKTWTGLRSFEGSNVWTDGDNVYFSRDDTQYVLNKATSTWSTKTWTGMDSFNGSNIWTDGENIYYSFKADQYVLNKDTSTWSEKTWVGLDSFNGSNIWTDGENIYYSSSSTQYVLDKATSTWSTKTWTGLTSFNGSAMWSDGENMYFSSGSSKEYVFDYVEVEEYNTYDIKDAGAREGLDNRGLVFKSEPVTGLPTPESRPELNGQVAMYNGDSQITVGGVDFIPGHFYHIETLLGASTYTFIPTGTMTIPLASTTAPGLMQVGSGLSVDANGVVSANGGGGGSSRSNVQYLRNIQAKRVMPEAGSSYNNLAYYYMGPTTEDFMNRSFYKCILDEDTNTYKWFLYYPLVQNVRELSEAPSDPESNQELFKYTGQTTGDFVNGRYYIGHYNSVTYQWGFVRAIWDGFYLITDNTPDSFRSYMGMQLRAVRYGKINASFSVTMSSPGTLTLDLENYIGRVSSLYNVYDIRAFASRSYGGATYPLPYYAGPDEYMVYKMTNGSTSNGSTLVIKENGIVNADDRNREVIINISLTYCPIND